MKKFIVMVGLLGMLGGGCGVDTSLSQDEIDQITDSVFDQFYDRMFPECVTMCMSIKEFSEMCSLQFVGVEKCKEILWLLMESQQSCRDHINKYYDKYIEEQDCTTYSTGGQVSDFTHFNLVITK